MLNRPELRRVAGLAELAPGYRAVLCDVWGVVHNGVAPFARAVEALAAFRREVGPVALLTNAPRPWPSVVEQLDRIGVDRDAYDAVVTSGDVARDVLRGLGQVRLHHIGPERDLPLYDGLDLVFADIGAADIACCTGLVDDERETVDDYAGRLAALAERGLAMICPNPDLVVERGSVMVPCAGALAERYSALGGAVVMAGKPYPPVYEAALGRLSELAPVPLDREAVLAIGDGLATDIRGANEFGLDALFIAGGIHRLADGDDTPAIAGLLAARGLTAVGYLPQLAWRE